MKKQTHLIVYSIPEIQNTNFWVRVGVAFVNKDGSLNVILDALPVNGRLHIRASQKKEEGV